MTPASTEVKRESGPTCKAAGKTEQTGKAADG